MYDPSGLYVDPILTQLSVGWADQTLYGLRLAPETPVRTMSGRYRVFDRSNWIIHRSLRAPGTVANEVGARKWSEDTFATKEHSLQAAIHDEERKALLSQGGLADPVFGGDLQIDPEADATDYVTRSIMMEHEKRVADTFRDTANYTGGNTNDFTSAQWSDYTYTGSVPNSNPVADLRAAFQLIYLKTGRWPNTFVYPFDGIGVVENHPEIVKRFQYTALADPNAWKTLLGFPPAVTEQLNVFIVDSKFNQADNVDVAEDIVSFWGQDAWLGIVDPTPGQKTMTFAKTFAQLYPDGTTKPTERWREENRKSDLVRTNYDYDLKIVSSVAGYLFQNVFAEVT